MRNHRDTTLLLAALAFLAIACVTNGPRRVRPHGWWAGLGPVLPHDTFPTDCSLCHVGRNWGSVTEDFEFDHEKETGVALSGAHREAQCLRCHNDRGPAGEFAALGCAGCHEDIHIGQLGAGCESCHQENTWRPVGQISMHAQTRFPLSGIHAVTACRRCHPGAEIGRFVPTDVECVTCHADDLQQALNPNHIGLGWVNRCDRCHMPVDWNRAEVDPNF